MEQADLALERIHDPNSNLHDILQNVTPTLCADNHLEVRLVYIPTAMYALRPESSSTPGKQRQRARADGKQRRNAIVQLLGQELEKVLPRHVVGSIRAVTLDLEDGSVKQPEQQYSRNSLDLDNSKWASSPRHSFPTTGQQVLDDWKPHLVYVQGGNTFWLYHCLVDKGHDWQALLTRLLKSEDGAAAFYCGASAGAIVAGASMETACWKGWDDPSVVPDRTTYADWRNVAGLDWCGEHAFFPHHSHRDWSDVVRAKGTLLRERNGAQTICLRDDQVCLVEGTARRIRII